MNNMQMELYLNSPSEKFLLGWENIEPNSSQPYRLILIHVLCFTLKIYIL
jgi:hypothetical protein